MAYLFTEPAGMQPVANTETTAKHVVGTIATAIDPLYGTGEFIYLLGVANTTVGSIVTYAPTTYQTTLAAAAGAVGAPVAIAMSANVASQYGWYQISGVAVVKKACTLCMVVGTYLAQSAGIAVTTASGKEISGAVVAATASAAAGRTTVSVMINRPRKQTRAS